MAVIRNVYITTGLGNEPLLDMINEKTAEYRNSRFDPIAAIYNKYLPSEDNFRYEVLVLILIILGTLILGWFCYPHLKKAYIQNKIKTRLTRNEYVPYYQPIVDPQTDEVIGFEALLRLNHPKKGILSPYFFMDEIEENDMLEEVTLWLVKRVMADYALINDLELFKGRHLYISLNLSTRELENKLFVQKIIEISKCSNVPSQGICLEIVEKFSISNIEHLKDGINVLKQGGFKIAIDDFGVDYSNLKVLELLDFDVLKLDKYFADEMQNSKIVRYMIDFLAELTLKLEKKLIMEGIEDVASKDWIKSLGYPNVLIQGYYYSKPMPIEEVKYFSVKS